MIKNLAEGQKKVPRRTKMYVLWNLVRFVLGSGNQSVSLATGWKVHCTKIQVVILLIIFIVTFNLLRDLTMEQINKGKWCVK